MRLEWSPLCNPAHHSGGLRHGIPTPLDAEDLAVLSSL
jgi:hypothetical protein